MDYLEIFSLPFMQRAFVSGIFLAALLSTLGVFVTLRKMAFFGEGVAHASLAGIAIAIFAGYSPLPIALAWAVFIAVAIYYLERSTKLHSDTLIGILFTASMALGVVLMSYTNGFQPELISFLFGSILSIKDLDLILIAALSTIIVSWVYVNRHAITYMSLSEDSAAVTGIPIKKMTMLFYISLAIATVLGVKVLGIILVSALLILPSAVSRMLSSSFTGYFRNSVIISEFIIFFGLVFSYLLDWPSGATIVLFGTVLFLLATIAGIDKRGG